MAWTAPRTWIAGETVTASIGNTHWRDNFDAIGGAWTAFTPAWKDGAGGAALSIGNGTLTGAYSKAGRRVAFRIVLIRGTTTNLGTTAHVFEVPFAPATLYAPMGAAFVQDASAATTGSLPHTWYCINASSEIVVVGTGGRRIDNNGFGTAPTAWATGDTVQITGTYEAAS